MSRHRKGWTLVEVMVSTTILALLLTLVAQALGMTQRSWVSSRATAEMQRHLDAATSALSQNIALATLQPRERFDATTNALVRESDLHFVCGPSSELLPALPQASGDAIFFQRPARDGALQAALQSRGFFVQYSDDTASRPGFLRSGTLRRRFRLMQFHASANDLPLFRPPMLSTLTARNELYAWFAHSITMPDHISVVAENVVAMIIQAQPGDQRCYDTRRHQWESETIAASSSRHRLPQTVEVTLIVTDEASWSKLDSPSAASIASDIIRQSSPSASNPDSRQKTITTLRDSLEKRGMRTRVAVISIPLPSDAE